MCCAPTAISMAAMSRGRIALATASMSRSTRGKIGASTAAGKRTTVLVPSSMPKRSCAPIETVSPIRSVRRVEPESTSSVAIAGERPYAASSAGLSDTKPELLARRNASNNSSACTRSTRVLTGDSRRKTFPCRVSTSSFPVLRNATRSTSLRSMNRSRRRNSLGSRPRANSCSSESTTW